MGAFCGSLCTDGWRLLGSARAIAGRITVGEPPSCDGRDPNQARSTKGVAVARVESRRYLGDEEGQDRDAERCRNSVEKLRDHYRRRRALTQEFGRALLRLE